MQTGLPTRSTLYSAHETCRAFGAAPPPGREGGDEGALLLLPHSCGLQLEALRLNNGKRRCVVSCGCVGGGGHASARPTSAPGCTALGLGRCKRGLLLRTCSSAHLEGVW